MNLEDEHKTIADVISKTVPNGWKQAWVDAVINDDHAKATYDYIDEQGNENWFAVRDINDGLALTRALRNIRDFMAEQTGDKWKKVRFTLNADGTFKTKFEYED